MAQKTLKAKKRKAAPKKAAKVEQKIVLVGTCKAGQLERWPEFDRQGLRSQIVTSKWRRCG